MVSTATHGASSWHWVGTMGQTVSRMACVVKFGTKMPGGHGGHWVTVCGHWVSMAGQKVGSACIMVGGAGMGGMA